MEIRAGAKRSASRRDTGGSATSARLCRHPERRQCFRRRSIPVIASALYYRWTMSTIERPSSGSATGLICLTYARCRATNSSQPAAAMTLPKTNHAQHSRFPPLLCLSADRLKRGSKITAIGFPTEPLNSFIATPAFGAASAPSDPIGYG